MTTKARDQRSRIPRGLALTLMSVFTLVASGALWAIAQAQTTCSFLEVPDKSIMPGPEPCTADATNPAILTAMIIAILLAVAFVFAFTVVKRRDLALVSIAGAMVLVAIIGSLATFAFTTTVPPIIYY